MLLFFWQMLSSKEYRQRFSLEKEVQDVGVVGRAEEGVTEQTPT